MNDASCPNEKLISYIKEDNDKKFDELKLLFERLETKVDLIFQFKWQIIGGSAAIGTIMAGIVVVLGFILKN